MLISGRLVSGLGGGGLIILSQATLSDVVPPRKLGTYMGVIGAVFAVSNVLGPLLGGWFVQVTGWRWIFWFTVPVALLAVVVLGLTLPRDARALGKHPIDWPGMMAMTVAVTSLVLAMAWGGTLIPWGSLPFMGLVALAVAAAVVFVLLERRAAEPIIPMGLFRNRNFVLCSVTGLFLNISFMGALNYLPTFFQIVDGLSPEVAGLVCTATSVGILITSTATGWVASKTGRYKGMLVAMCVVRTVGLLLLSRMQVHEALWVPVLLPVRARLRHGARHAAARARGAKRVSPRHGGHRHGGEQLLPADRRFGGHGARGRAVHHAPYGRRGRQAHPCGQPVARHANAANRGQAARVSPVGYRRRLLRRAAAAVPLVRAAHARLSRDDAPFEAPPPRHHHQPRRRGEVGEPLGDRILFVAANRRLLCQDRRFAATKWAKSPVWNEMVSRSDASYGKTANLRLEKRVRVRGLTRRPRDRGGSRCPRRFRMMRGSVGSSSILARSFLMNTVMELVSPTNSGPQAASTSCSRESTVPGLAAKRRQDLELLRGQRHVLAGQGGAVLGHI